MAEGFYIDTDATGITKTRIEEMRDARSNYVAKYEDEINEYENVEPLDTDDYRTTLITPVLTGQIDSKLSDELRAPFDVRFIPEGADAIPYAEARGKIFDSIWAKTRGNYHRHIAFLQKNVNGDSVIMPVWRTLKRKVKKSIVKIKDGERIIDFKEEEITVYDDIALMNIPARECLFDPDAKDIESSADFAWDRVIGKELFLERYKGFDNVTEATNAGCTSTMFKTEDENSQGDKLINVVDYFNIITDTYKIFANDILIHESPMPIKILPVAHYRNRPKSESIRSMSERDITGQLIEERNVHRNMVIDFNKAHIDGPILVQGDIEFDEANVEFGINTLWHVGDVNGVKRLQNPNIISSPNETTNMIDIDITKVSGIDLNALIADGSESATKTITKQRSQLKRIETNLKFNSYSADQRLVSIMMMYVDLYYSIPRVGKVLNDEEKESYKKYREIRVEDVEVIETGTGIEFKTKKGNVDFFEVTPELLEGKFEVRVSTGDNIPVSKELQEQRMTELLQVMVGIPTDPNTGKIPPLFQPLVRKLFEAADINTDDFAAVFDDGEEEVSDVDSKLASFGVQPPPQNQQPNRAPRPEEMNIGQKGLPDRNNARVQAQLTAQDVGV